mgnify:CR=1 FL=1
MLVAVSTVMDTLEHVRRYVTGNLAGGVDHLVVFLDKPSGDGQDEVLAWLEDQPQVTAVRAGGRWWGERRPQELNERQCTNANVAKAALAGLGHPDAWVLHVDGDEVARVDRSRLDALSGADSGVDPGVDAVRLAVREAVSRAEWPGEPDLWKAELDDDELDLLAGLGLLSEPSNQVWIRGHLMGKTAARAGSATWLTLHKAVDAERRQVPAHEDDAFTVHHYESYSADDFVRKWVAMVGAGPRASYRAERRTVARTLRTLISRDLPEDALRRALLRYYDTHVAEPVEALRDVGVLHEVDPLAPLAPGRVPEPLDAAGLAAALEAHRGADKSAYFRGASPAKGGGTPSARPDDAGGQGAARRALGRVVRGKG